MSVLGLAKPSCKFVLYIERNRCSISVIMTSSILASAKVLLFFSYPGRPG